MAQNFIECDREQPFLLPPDVREWLPEDHLAWFVIDAVGVMDTAAFYAAYREDGHGRAASEPSMMIALLLYCWSRGVRSSRAIERACVEDVACRVIAAHQRPDHATIARFIERHERALADLFGDVLALCTDAGLATVGVIAIDGTRGRASAIAASSSTSRSSLTRRGSALARSAGRALAASGSPPPRRTRRAASGAPIAFWSARAKRDPARSASPSRPTAPAGRRSCRARWSDV
jgi:transposase